MRFTESGSEKHVELEKKGLPSKSRLEVVLPSKEAKRIHSEVLRFATKPPVESSKNSLLEVDAKSAEPWSLKRERVKVDRY